MKLYRLIYKHLEIGKVIYHVILVFFEVDEVMERADKTYIISKLHNETSQPASKISYESEKLFHTVASSPLTEPSQFPFKNSLK
jgi:hypothetical protein